MTMQQVPMLILSDCPSQTSGLARITRDLATLIASMPEFRVASLGVWGIGSTRLPFMQYHIRPNTFGEDDLPLAWDEFAQGQAGIVLAIFDLSRLLWLARPEFVEKEWLREWLLDARKRKFKFWCYTPIDSTGPMNKLTEMSKQVLLGCDRILTPSPWAMGIVRNTIGTAEAEVRGNDWLPHGLGLRTFHP
jgi:hypothetical protein